MKNLFNSFYSIVLLVLCLIAFSNCSDSDDGGDVGDTDNGITAIGYGEQNSDRICLVSSYRNRRCLLLHDWTIRQTYVAP